MASRGITPSVASKRSLNGLDRSVIHDVPNVEGVAAVTPDESSSQLGLLPTRFRIEQEIGRGGMAVVYRAHDQHLDRYVAIKVLSSGMSHSLGPERFQREIALMAKLVHPGIVALFDAGEVAGQLYYVMPFVAGETLRVRLVRERRLPVAVALAYGADIAEALAYAHGFGIVHRDVKPENIFTVGGRAVLADFGIARIAGPPSPGGENLTTAGIVVGTVAYMSPEQATGGADIDGRSDLYSLGCVLYELLVGAPPFVAGSFMGVLSRHLTEAPRPLRDHDPGLPGPIDDLLMQLLAKEPSQRPATAGDVARALRAARMPSRSSSASSTISEPDRLVAEGQKAYRFGASGGGSARSHFEQAEVYFRRALALDPHHARGLCGLGNWHYLMGNLGWLPRLEAFAKGRELLLAALSADDQCAEVHCSLGKAALYYDDDCHSAARHTQRAFALDASSTEVLRFQSILFKILGRVEDAIGAAQMATTLSSDLPSLWNALGDALLAAGRNAEAIDALKRAIALQPGYSAAVERLELARRRLGELDLALESRMSRLALAGQTERTGLLEAEAKTLGPAEALHRDLRRELDAFLAQAEQGDPFADPSNTRTLADRIVLGYAELGEWHRAMDWVENAYQRRPGRLRRMLTDLPFDHRGLAVDPRYARLLRMAGLEDLL